MQRLDELGRVVALVGTERDLGIGSRGPMCDTARIANGSSSTVPVRSPSAWSNTMTTSEFAAESLVRTYLSGRTMEPILFRAVVWMAEKRLTSGMMPVLDTTMRTDIDNQAGATQWRGHSSQSWSKAPTVCTLLHRAYMFSPPMPGPIGTPLHRASHRTVGRNSEGHSRG
jgi:hypothetical protein